MLWQVNAQYKPMLVEGNQWNELYTTVYAGLTDRQTFITKVGGDTIFNGKIYKKILNGATNKTHSYMREDINKQAVYRLDDTSSSEPYKEYLTYKFNLEMGDILFVERPSGMLTYEVKEIREISPNNDGILHKLYTILINESDTYQWIEGIGGLDGLINSVEPAPNGGGKTELLCFSQNNETYYKNDAFDTCYIWDEPSKKEIFPMADAIWSIANEDRNKLWNYGLIGDTLIDYTPYKKLYLLSDTLLTIDENSVYVGAILQGYQRVIIKPAKQKNGTQLPEYLLYDFTGKQGEAIDMGERPFPYMDGPTFENVYNNYGPTTFHIYEDKMGKWGRELHLDENTIWIEGVGSLNGLFFGPLRYPTGGGSGGSGKELMCLKVKDEIKYLDPDCPACFQSKYSSLESDKMQASVSVLYKSESQSIEISTEVGGLPFQFSLTSLDGRMVENFTVNDMLTTVNASALAKRVYIYNVVGDKVSLSGKFIVK